jgi:hypothetical protein
VILAGKQIFNTANGMWATVDSYELNHDYSDITSIKYLKNNFNIVDSFLDYAQMAIKMYMEYTELRHASILTTMLALDILWSLYESVRNLFSSVLLNTGTSLLSENLFSPIVAFLLFLYCFFTLAYLCTAIELSFSFKTFFSSFSLYSFISYKTEHRVLLRVYIIEHCE